jgi:hypothetical protein
MTVRGGGERAGGACGRLTATTAVVVLGMALGYSIGVSGGAGRRPPRQVDLAVDPVLVRTLEEAAERARDRGDDAAAAWFDATAAGHRARMTLRVETTATADGSDAQASNTPRGRRAAAGPN